MRRSAIVVLMLCVGGCLPAGPLVGIVSPDSILSRTLRIRNDSREYVVVRLTVPGAAPVLTPVLCPGAEDSREMLSQFGTLCPASMRIEIAGYARAHPELSPLDDETLVGEPFVAVTAELTATRDYGCQADPSLVSLDKAIECVIVDADAQAGTVAFRMGFLPPQQQTGVQIADPPAPTSPEMFPLRGRIVDLDGKPMAEVEVRLPQIGASVATDAEGRFSVMRQTGNYLLEPVLPGVEVSPVLQSFSHLSPDEVPVEFIALTHSGAPG